MERGLLIVSLVLSLVLGAIGLAPPRTPGRLPWFAAVPGLLAFLISLPSTGPFAVGQALGTGILLGTVLGTVSGWLALRERPAAAAALAGSAVALVALRGAPFPLEQLLGIALGYLTTQCVLGIVHRETLSTLCLSSATMTAALTAAALGTFRANGGPITPWLSVAAVLASVGSLFAFLAARLVAPARQGLVAVVAAVVLVLVLRPLLLPTTLSAWTGAGCGGGGILLAALLLWQGTGDSMEKRGLGALLTLGAILLASHLAQGFGIALLALGLALGGAIGGGAGLLSLPMTLAVLAALWRLFAQRWTDVRWVSLHEQYLLLGLLLGGVLPLVAAGIAERRPTLAGVLKCGSLMVGVPLIATVLYGPPVAMALLLGLLAMTLWRIATETVTASAAPLFSLALATALTQFVGNLEPLSDGSRLARLKLSAVGVVAIAVVFVVSRGLGKRKP